MKTGGHPTAMCVEQTGPALQSQIGRASCRERVRGLSAPHTWLLDAHQSSSFVPQI